jgi:small subunit ribosomal protein S16
MLTIRFSRVGKKKAPIYRIVVQAKHRDPWSPAIEILGHYNPQKNPKEVVVKGDRVKHWLSQGAQASDSVWNLMVEQKIVEGEKRSTTHISKKHAGRLEQAASEAKAKQGDPSPAEPAKDDKTNKEPAA